MIKLLDFTSGTFVPLKWWTFPGGERSVRVDPDNLFPKDTQYFPKSVLIECKFKSSDDLIDILLLNNAVRNMGIKNVELSIPYFPFARQDRVMVDGEPFALQVAAQLLNSCGFSTITVQDPHSDVLAGMFAPGVLKVDPQWELWGKLISKELMIDESRAYDDMAQSYPNGCLVSPDAGALKKIYKLAKLTNLPVVEAGKTRNVETGEIVATTIDNAAVSRYNTFWVVDDICDGGRTFIELAKVIRETNPTAKLVLCVTHGIFSKGKDVLKPAFDEVICINDLSEVK